jgi:glycosyltransferase involved in cell wall biosynthesis
LRLVLLGETIVDLGGPRDVVVTGFVDEQTRNDALAGALALAQPSYFESFSLVLCESFAHGRPALVQGRSAVLAGHAHRSHAAIPYSGFAEFEAAVDVLIARPELADEMGEAGRRYVAREYGWETVLDRYEALLTDVVARRQASSTMTPAGQLR